MKKIYVLLLCSIYFLSFSQTVESKILEMNFGGDSEPDHLTQIGEKLFFSAKELWIKDSPNSKARLVKDIYSSGNAIEAGSDFINFNGVLLFTARGNGSGSYRQLWRSNGLAEGTTFVKIINPDYDAQISNPVIVGNKLYFSSFVNNSSELWVTDGTSDGTYLIKKINSSGNSKVSNLFSFQNKIYFTASDGVHGEELWSTDGTESGTEMIVDFFPGTQKGIFGKPVAYNDEIYFLGARSTTTNGFWKWNSITNSLTLVKSVPYYFYASFDTVKANNLLYFVLYGQDYNRYLWSSDGTPENTKQIFDGVVESSYKIPDLLKFKNQIHMNVSVAFGEFERWFLDLNSNTFKKVSDIIPVLQNTSLTASSSENKYLLFSANSKENWLTDGTASGTYKISDLEIIANYTGYNFNLLDYDKNIIMNATTDENGVELFRYNFANQTTELVEDLNHIYGHNGLASETLNGKLIYFGQDNTHGYEVFTSDGTEAGTHLLKDINSQSFGSTIFSGENPQFFKHNNKLYYRCTDGTGYEPCVTDGTPEGTKILKNISQFYQSINADPFFNKFDDNTILFGADDGTNNTASASNLWRTDGTEQGTYQLSRINIISGGTAKVNGNLYYSTENNLQNSQYIYSIAQTNGTSAGTKIFKTVLNEAGRNVFVNILGDIQNRMIYSFNFTDLHGSNEYDKLISSDGTNPNNDIELGKFSSIFRNGIVYKNRMYFYGRLFGDNMARLFETDGTVSGTKIATEILTNVINSETQFFQCNDKLFVNTGNRLYVKDGNSEFTLLNDSPISKFQKMKCLLNTVFFADKKFQDNKIWISNGTIAGTKALNLLVNGQSTAGWSYLDNIGVTDTKLFYNAYFPDIPEVQISGNELFITDISSLNLDTNEIKFDTDAKSKSFIVYPNPAAEIANVINPYKKVITSVTLQSMEGKLLKYWTKNEAKSPLNLEGLITGIYLLHIKTEDGASHTYKVIKK